MDSVKQDAYFRQRVLKYAENHAVSDTARLYRISRMSIYRWRDRWDGTVQSLMERSSRPHSHPRKHTPEEDELVLRLWKKHPEWLLDVLWQELRSKHGYTRGRTTLYRALRRLGVYKRPKSKKKPRMKRHFPAMEFAGQQVQIDVKHVPAACHSGMLGGKKLYQFTAVDAYSRWEFKLIYDDHSSTSAVRFLVALLRAAPFPILCVQTDNGTEFTNRFVSGTKRGAFEKTLARLQIQHRLIRPATPRHNGKVERVHRFDQRLFYSVNIFHSLAHANRKLAAYLAWCNNRTRAVLANCSPNALLHDFLAVAA